MNAKAKRRRAVPAPPRPEGPAEQVPEAGAAGAAEGRREAPAGCAFPAGGLVLLDQLPASAFRRIEIPGEVYAPCNPSIAADGAGNLACIVRTVNYELGEEDGIWFRGDPAPNTRNWFVPIGSNLEPGAPVLVDDVDLRRGRPVCEHGIEDARLFWQGGAWWFTATGLHHGARVRTTMVLCRLDGSRVDVMQVLHSPHGRPTEKNWMPCVRGDRLGYVYSHHVAESYELSPPKRLHIGYFPDLEGWSGGSQIVPFEGGLVGVVHQRRKHRNRVHYVHRVVRYGENLEPIGAGREFYFRGEQVEFCAGLVQHGEGFVMSFGVKDREAWLVSLTAGQISALLARE